MSDESSKLSSSPGPRSAEVPPRIPDHELLQCIGEGSYGQVWLARNVMGEPRAVKVVDRRKFRDDETAYEREFKGIRLYEPISRSHESLVQILHVGRDDEAGCFYYVMELADAVEEIRNPKSETRMNKLTRSPVIELRASDFLLISSFEIRNSMRPGLCAEN